MATILFYTPFSDRSRDAESLILAFNRQGHRVISLNQAPGDFNAFLAGNGIETYSFLLPNSGGLWFYLRHILYFVWFCRTQKVDVVYSHLDSANIVSSIAQYFVSARVMICRHHGDLFSFANKKPGWFYWLTYRLAKRIIVVSQATKNYMVEHENVAKSKISIIRLAYDFNLYPKVNDEFVRQLRERIGTNVVLITVGQFIPIKRPDVSIRVLKRIVETGIDAKLILLGRGEMEMRCRQLASDLEIGERVIFPGHVGNVLDYISASTVLLHPSISESSCVVVKEAGLVNKLVIACKGIGDFDDYLVHGTNAFLVDSDNYDDQAARLISDFHMDKVSLGIMGQALHASIIRLFGVDGILGNYSELNRG